MLIHHPIKLRVIIANTACTAGPNDIGSSDRQQRLISQPRVKTGTRLPQAVTQSIIHLKTENQARSARHISEIPTIDFWIFDGRCKLFNGPAHVEGAGTKQICQKYRPKNPSRQQFFEMARLNQILMTL